METNRPSFFRSLRSKVHNFFFPPVGASRLRRILPYAILGVLTLIVFTAGTFAWDYTNSPSFCGTSCHTMTPEYAAYQVSPHARVACVDCHIGRGFVATRITRKAGDLEHVFDTLFEQYEFPIYASKLRPARETCEQCHFPEKVSDDSLRRNIHYQSDEANTAFSVYLAMRTGGGSRRLGLGRGIHWHVENEVWFVATDDLQQEIPYVRVVGPDGDEDVYVALNSSLTREELEAMPQVRMDCITCHNRISHFSLPPEQAVDQALLRQQISDAIPYIRREAVRVLSDEYASNEEAFEGIRTLTDYYQNEYPEYYAENQEEIDEALDTLIAIYDDTVFREQQVDWTTHPNNLGHTRWPGCWRCHDGQHLSADQQAIRLECNLCHSIPEVVGENVIEPVLPLATGNQPESHFSSLWIVRHRSAFDQTCQACHTVTNPGGTDNSSFCSNSACHGSAWEYADLDAPGLAEIIAQQEEAAATEEAPGPVPTGEPTDEPEGSESLTWDGQIGALFAENCTMCHSGSAATGGLVLETYNDAMLGGEDGEIILPGDAEGSKLVQVQSEDHFANFTDDELALIIEWINSGAPEN